MSFSGSNRRPTERISRRKEVTEDSEQTKSSTNSSRRSPTTQPSQKKPVAPEAETKTNSSRRSPAPQPSQKLPSSQSSKQKPSIVNKPSDEGVTFKVNETKKSEKLPVSTISKRQTIVPATEAKKSSAKLPVAEPTKPSARIPAAKPEPTPNTNSSKRSPSMETTIAKPQIGSVSSRKLAQNTEKEEAPIEPVKSSTKRSRAGSTGSSQRGGRASAKGASRKGGASQNSLNIVYIVMGLIILVFVGLIGNSLLSDKKGKTITQSNQVDVGLDLCNQAQKLYGADEDNAPEALKILQDGISKMNTELDKLRDSSGNLPAKYRGYEQKLADWNGFLKMMREKAYIVTQRKAKRNGN